MPKRICPQRGHHLAVVIAYETADVPLCLVQTGMVLDVELIGWECQAGDLWANDGSGAGE